jgi:Icc-related predicted phosphoesterase
MSTPPNELYFAVVGDVHGQMNQMLKHLRAWTTLLRRNFDFVLQVGDFEPHRHEADLATMDAPAKYRHLGDFAHYYAKRRYFPWPLYFIGGNHEPYGYLDTHPEGFELMHHCHYLGRVGVVELHGLRVVGLSGIHREDRFTSQRPDVSLTGTVSNKDFTSFNERDIERALDLGRADVLLLHDWPSGIVRPEDAADFEQQRRSPRYDTVGNDYARLLVEALQPRVVCCGHLHKAYRGVIPHASGPPTHVCCLASVDQDFGSVAVFHFNQGVLHELSMTSCP